MWIIPICPQGMARSIECINIPDYAPEAGTCPDITLYKSVLEICTAITQCIHYLKHAWVDTTNELCLSGKQIIMLDSEEPKYHGIMRTNKQVLFIWRNTLYNGIALNLVPPLKYTSAKINQNRSKPT